MFYVRSALALPPPTLSRALPVHADGIVVAPHASRAAPLPASHAHPLTRQYATAFNQALSFDTSKVDMLTVRSARALALPQP